MNLSSKLPIVLTSSGLACTHAVILLIVSVNPCTNERRVALSTPPFPPSAMDNDSHAPLSWSISPARLSIWISATFLAAPAEFSSCLVSSVNLLTTWPVFLSSTPVAATSGSSLLKCSCPAIPLKISMRWSVDSFSVLVRISLSKAPKSFIVPSLLTGLTLIVSSASLAGFGNVASRAIIALMPVPASEPLIPTLPSSPIAAWVCSRLAPYILATGAAIFMASPISSIPTDVLLAVDTITSPSRPISFACIPKALSTPPEISAARATSNWPAAAKSNVPANDSKTCWPLRPAAPNSNCAWAAWLAEKADLAPSVIAWLRSIASSLDLASSSSTAWVALICLSNAIAGLSIW